MKMPTFPMCIQALVGHKLQLKSANFNISYVPSGSAGAEITTENHKNQYFLCTDGLDKGKKHN